MKKGSKFLSLVTMLLTMLFSLSAGLALPMLWRGWYDFQIEFLGLPARTGWSPAVIREAYDQVMDFLLFDFPFGTGQLKWSHSGMAHFADCKFLFRLDLILFAVTGAILLGLILALLFFPGFRRKFAFSPPLAAFLLTFLVLGGLGIWAYLDFEGFFTAFHALLFPGKTNWLFDYRTDQIILALPEDFWAWTAGLAAATALAIELFFSLFWAILRRFSRPKTVYEELRALDQ